MTYRKTKRSKETLARMQAGKAAARMARPAPDYLPPMPELRRRIVIESFDFGHDVHVMEFYRTNRIDCFRVVVDGREWKKRIGFSMALAGLRKSLPRVGSV